MLLINLLIYVLVFVAYYFFGKTFNLTTPTYPDFNHSAVYGGGIIFSIIYLIETLISNTFGLFSVLVLLLTIISFFDDIRPIPSLYKLIIHLILGFIAAIFILKLNFNDVFAITFLVGIIITFYTNANNFMDGVNGMMIVNNIVILATLLFVNSYIIQFTNNNPLISLLSGALIFSVFNFRRKALLISGDAGSVVMGFIIIIFVLNLYLKTKNVFVFGLIITFSVETASTIISRLYSKKNILDSHKEHLYEVLVFKNKVSVIKISSIYGVIQLLLSGIVLISFYSQLENKIFYVTIFIYILIYFFLKYKLLKYAKYD